MSKIKLTGPQRALLLRFKWRLTGKGDGFWLYEFNKVKINFRVLNNLIEKQMVKAHIIAGKYTITQAGLDYLEGET